LNLSASITVLASVVRTQHSPRARSFFLQFSPVIFLAPPPLPHSILTAVLGLMGHSSAGSYSDPSISGDAGSVRASDHLPLRCSSPHPPPPPSALAQTRTSRCCRSWALTSATSCRQAVRAIVWSVCVYEVTASSENKGGASSECCFGCGHGQGRRPCRFVCVATTRCISVVKCNCVLDWIVMQVRWCFCSALVSHCCSRARFNSASYTVSA